MYSNIKEFREFIINATYEQIVKAIYFINMVGFFEGNSEGIGYNDFDIVKDAIDFAESGYDFVKDFLIAKLGINVED